MRRLAIFWLACAAVGFLAAVGAAYVLSLAVDGAGSWRGGQAPRPPHGAQAPSNSASAAPPAIVAPALNRAGR